MNLFYFPVARSCNNHFSNGHSEDATGCLLMFMNDIFEQIQKRLNGSISLHNVGRKTVEPKVLYELMPVLLLKILSSVCLETLFDAFSRH